MFSEDSNSPKAVKSDRRLKAHDGLIFVVIQRQAGTLAKGLLEGVMNSIDAGATRIDVTLTHDQYTIEDDGRGFRDMEHVETCFETLGTPHELDANGCSLDATFGTFRVGRGQLFAFARTIWRSGQFEMDVDLKRRGLDYQLKQNLKHYPGCRIEGELYDSLAVWDIKGTIDDLTKYCRYCHVPIRLNGQLISEDPKTLKWDIETSEYYANYKDVPLSRGLHLYQLGVFVAEFGQWRYKMAGTVVTKVKLKLNMARNDVMQDCKTFARIKKKISEQALKHLMAQRGILTENEITTLFKAYEEKLIHLDKIKKVKLLEDVSGHMWSLNDIVHAATTNSRWEKRPDLSLGIAWIDSPSVVADKVMQQRRGLVLKEQSLRHIPLYDREGRDKTLEWLGHLLRCVNHRVTITMVPLEALAETMNVQYELIDQKILTRAQKQDLEILAQADHYILSYIRDVCPDRSKDYHRRTLRLGRSEHATAWTDGHSYIALSADLMVKHRPTTQYNIAFWVNILTHEYLHSKSSAGSHVHSPEFYRSFHDVVTRPWFGNIACHVFRTLQMRTTKALRNTERGRNAVEKRSSQFLPAIRDALIDWLIANPDQNPIPGSLQLEGESMRSEVDS